MNYKKFLCGMLTASMLTVSAFAADFPDTADHWARTAIERWSGYGVVNGYDDGSFGPNDSITRAQMAVILDRIFGWKKQAENPFRDLVGTEWYAGAVLRANAAGVLGGDDAGNARPAAPVTRAEAAVMLDRALSLEGKGQGETFTDDAYISDWARKAVADLSSLGLIAGTPAGAFEPGRPITRAEALTILDRAVGGYYDRAGVYTESTEGVLCVIAAPGVTLRDMTITGDLIIVPGAEGSETILSDVVVTGRTRILSGRSAQVLVKGESRLNMVEVAGEEGRLRLDETAEIKALTVSGSGAQIRGLDEQMEVTVTESARDVLINGHKAESGSVIRAGKDISSDADDLEVEVEPEEGGSSGGSQGGEPDEPQEPDKPEEPEEPAGGERDEEGNIIVDFDDLLNSAR